MKLYTTKDLRQRTVPWFDARCGRVCSSEVGAVIAADGRLRKARNGNGRAESVKTYVNKLVSELLSGYVAISDYASTDMQYGARNEESASGMLSLITDMEFEAVGGMLSDCRRWWASSDGVSFWADGSVKAVAEIKTPTPKRMVGYLLDPESFVEEYIAQVAVEIIVSGAEVGYLFAYGPGLKASESHVLRTIEAGDQYVLNVRASLNDLGAMVVDALAKLGAECFEPPPAPKTAAEIEAEGRDWLRRMTA